MIRIITVLLSICSCSLFAQDTINQEDAEDEIFHVTEEVARFYGGQEKMEKFIKNNLKYPKKALRKKIEGSIIVQVIIDKEGYVKEPTVIDGNNLGFGLPEEALRIVSNMPQWVPAHLETHTAPKRPNSKLFVSMKTEITIKFNISNYKSK
jgi:TonB family protein